MKNIGVILSAGIGNRFNNSLPKQYHMINGKMVIEYVINALKKSDKLDDIIVMCGDNDFCTKIYNKFNVKTLVGGNTRNETIMIALNYITEKKVYNKVLFFDSARPNQNPQYINECIDLLNNYDSVITTQHITDSLGTLNDITLDRSQYFLIQTPECFKVEALNNFDVNSNCTAIVQQLNKNCKIYNNYNLPNNIKITYPSDIEIASVILGGKK